MRMRPDEDLKLGKINKIEGLRTDVVNGVGMIAVEWYGSVPEAIRGLEKNTFSGTDYNVPLTVFSTVLSVGFNVWPYLAVFFVAGPPGGIFPAFCLAVWAPAWNLARTLNAPRQ